MTGIRRFTASKPCPVCGGSPRNPRGTGTRCWGFYSADGRYAHCTRDEHSNGQPSDTSQSYRHDLIERCGCGVTHFTTEKGCVVAAYDYKDASGTLVYQAVRFDPKGFALRRLDPTGRWVWKLDGLERLPYRLPELLAAPAD